MMDVGGRGGVGDDSAAVTVSDCYPTMMGSA